MVEYNKINTKLSNLQVSKLKTVVKNNEGTTLALLEKLAGTLMKVAVPLGKNMLAPLRLTAAMSAIDGAIQKKIHGSGTTTLVISNEEMDDIMKIVQALEDSNILLKGVSKTIKNEIKKQKGGTLGMLLGTLGPSLLGNLLTCRGFSREGQGTTRAGRGFLRVGKGAARVGEVFFRAGQGIKKSSNSTTSFNKLWNKRLL